MAVLLWAVLGMAGYGALAKLVPLAALVDDDLSLVALRAAAKRGRLDARDHPDEPSG